METLAQKATQYFENHYNCAESVILAAREVLGSRYHLSSSVATLFGGGIARQGMMCGALTGTLLLVGLAHGRSSPQEKEQYKRAMEMSEAILERFRKEHGRITCKELTGYDLANPEERKGFETDPQRRERCRSFVETAARVFGEIVEDYEKKPQQQSLRGAQEVRSSGNT